MKPQQLKYSELKSIDFDHVWHPFTPSSVWFEQDPIVVESAEGFELIDTAGRRYIDGVSSIWCNVHGHGVPELVSALKEQSEKVCHSTLLGLSHRPLLELTRELFPIFPKGLERIFYADSGSAAVEAALRMSLEWWQKQDSAAGKRRVKLLSLDEAYHGDTLGAVGVGFSDVFHKHIAGSVVAAHRTSTPHTYRFYEGLSPEAAEERSLADLRKVLEQHGDEIAAFIVEPLMQGAAGMWRHSEKFLQSAIELCRGHEILVIVDEVATGFGKSGRMFACEVAGITPDILIVGKGITGGYLPMSAAVVSEKIFANFCGKFEERKTFYYGQTYAGNPLAAAVALASLRLFQKPEFFLKLQTRIEHYAAELERQIASLPQVAEIRRLGLMTGIEFTSIPGGRKAYPSDQMVGPRVVREARDRGALIRPLGNTMILMPAVAMDEKTLSRLVNITAESITAVLGA